MRLRERTQALLLTLRGLALSHRAVVVAGLGLTSVLPYLSTLRSPFLNWDDYALILGHPFISAATWQNVRLIFTPGAYGAFQPLRDLSYMLDYARAGLDPAAYHTTNLLLFTTTNLAAYALLRRLGAGWIAALFGALVFALHPVHVEAVAWLAARKEVLSGTFFFAGAALYLGARRAAGGAAVVRYALALACATFSALSKPVAVTLPAVLLLLEWQVLRVRGRGPWLRAGLALLPFLAVAALITVITLQVSAGGDTLKSQPPGGLRTMFLTWPLSTAKHIQLLVWPAELSARYANAYVHYWTEPRFLASTLALGGLAALTVLVRRLWPNWVLAVLWFLVTLAPVSNFIPISTLVADRYVFLPSFALSILAAAAASVAITRGRSVRVLSAVAGLALLALLGTLTAQRSFVWKDSIALWGSVVEAEPFSAFGRLALGNVQAEAGKYEAAITEYQRALGRDPRSTLVVISLARAYLATSRFDLALGWFRRAVAMDSASAPARFGLAEALERSSRFVEAIPAYDSARVAGTPMALVLVGQARCYLSLERPARAVGALREALEQDPAIRTPSTYVLLGRACRELGRHDEAGAALQTAIQLGGGPEVTAELAEALLARGQPGPARALIDRALLVHRDLPGLLATRGRVAEFAGDSTGALGWYWASLAKDSTASGVWTALAELQEGLGTEAAAESSYSAAERHDPTGRSAINLGAFQLARGHLGLADSALARARRLLGDDPTLLYNLACLQARRGERDSALALLRRAARLGFTGEAAMRADPDLASLRAAPGFRTVLRQVAANETR